MAKNAQAKRVVLKDLYRLLGPFGDFQLIDSRSGKSITSVTYLDGTSERAEIDMHEHNAVHGIAAGVASDGLPYVIISLDDNE